MGVSLIRNCETILHDDERNEKSDINSPGAIWSFMLCHRSKLTRL